MGRKLVKHGEATMMVSLPAKWLKKNNLEKGDEVNIEELSNELRILTKSSNSKKETEINIGNFSESSIRTVLTNSYRLGFDKIKINFESSDICNLISKLIQENLIGFEIIQKNSKSCIIENITEPSSDQFDNIFLKILLNIEELYDISELMLKNEKKEFLDIEIKIQQFYNFCLRVITKNTIENSQLKWTFYTELIKGQREIYHMLKYLKKSKVKFDKEIIDLLRDSKEIYEILKKAYKEKNISDVEKIHILNNELIYKKGYNLLTKKEKDGIIIMHILNSIRHYYFASSPLIGLFLDVKKDKKI